MGFAVGHFVHGRNVGKKNPNQTQTCIQNIEEPMLHVTPIFFFFFATICLSGSHDDHQPGNFHPCLDSTPAKPCFWAYMSGFSGQKDLASTLKIAPFVWILVTGSPTTFQGSGNPPPAKGERGNNITPR